MKTAKATIAIFLTATLAFAVGCHKDNTCGVPHGYGLTLDLSLPQLYNLAHNGGSVTIDSTFGNIFYDGICYKGIYVIRVSQNEYRAYECACPHDHDVAVVPPEGWEGSLLQCPKCKSIFNIYADGIPLDGSATPCSLYEYSTFIESDGYHLTIY